MISWFLFFHQGFLKKTFFTVRVCVIVLELKVRVRKFKIKFKLYSKKNLLSKNQIQILLSNTYVYLEIFFIFWIFIIFFLCSEVNYTTVFF